MSTTTTPIQTAAGTWRLDPVHSSVTFEVDYLGGTFRGSFRNVAARLDLSDDAAGLEGAAQVASVDVKDENLAGHLQGPDFFDAEREPELRFAAAGITLDGESVRVDGEITIKGVTRAVSAAGKLVPPVTDPHGNERIGLTLAARVDRRDFGVDWNADLPGGGKALADEVAIKAELYFVKA